jgi:hypothetical protein
MQKQTFKLGDWVSGITIYRPQTVNGIIKEINALGAFIVRTFGGMDALCPLRTVVLLPEERIPQNQREWVQAYRRQLDLSRSHRGPD